MMENKETDHTETAGSAAEDASPKKCLIQNSKVEKYGSITGDKLQQSGTSGFRNDGFIGDSTSSSSGSVHLKMDDGNISDSQGSMALMENPDANMHHIPNGFDKSAGKSGLPAYNLFGGSAGLKPRSKVFIQRDCLDQRELDEKCDYNVPKAPSIRKRVLRRLYKSCSCSSSCLRSCLMAHFPIIQWMREYKFQNYFPHDLIAGFTIAILHIPQGMGYGLLASVDAINGLYVSFFPVLMYVLMGTSRHISIGTFAVVSLMVSSAADKLGAVASRGTYGQNFTSAEAMTMGNNSTVPVGDSRELSNLWPPTYLEVLTTICLMTGLIQAVMGKLRLGAISVVLTDQIVSGFSTGVAVHVATSQLTALFNISVPRYSGPFKLGYTYIDIFKNLKYSSVPTIIVSAITIFILYVVKEQIQPRLKGCFTFPIPIDLIVVIVATVSSYFLKLNSDYGVAVMGYIPTGFPSPIAPRMDLIPYVLVDSFTLALITLAVSLSLGKIFAKKHNYSINPNQELVALGAANVFSSFFQCYPCSASLSRSLVQEKAGGKTQMTGIISCIIMGIVLACLGPYLYCLPKCILSGIIIVALKGMFMQVADFKSSWKVSHLEAMIWLVTFVGVIVLDIDFGLIIGVVFSLSTIILRSLYPHSSLLARVPNTEIYVDSDRYQMAKEVPGVKIFHFTSPIFFLNRSILRQFLFQHVFENQSDIQPVKGASSLHHSDIHSIIIDCSAIPYIDSAGVEEIMQIREELKELDIELCLAACTKPFYEMLKKTGYLTEVGHSTVFPTVHDAVLSCVPTVARIDAMATV